MYGENDISTAFDFYGKPAEDYYEGHKSYSPPLLNCTLDSLKLEYGGYKTYVATSKNKVTGELELQLNSLNAKLICANAQKYKPTLIMTDKRTRLEPESINSLMRISYNSGPLSTEEVNAVIDV